MQHKYRVINKYKILCQIGGTFVSYYKGKLFYHKAIDSEPVFLLCLPKKKKLPNWRIIERALRLEPRVAISLNDTEFLLSYQGEIYRINLVSSIIVSEHIYRKGVNNPLSFCEISGRILYGEYFGKRSNSDVRIYERNKLGKWNPVYSFPNGSVVHIHHVVFDKYRNCFWILTGDTDDESGIWKATNDFSVVEPFLVGKQIYRSCFLVPEIDGFSYATDTPLYKNAIYKVLLNNNNFVNITKKYEIPGPCIYGKVIDEDRYILATSVEPDPCLSKYRYRITRKLGHGVMDYYTHIIVGYSSGKYEEIIKFKKDLLPIWLFQFGNVQFPPIAMDKRLVYLTGQSLKKISGKTVEIQI